MDAITKAPTTRKAYWQENVWLVPADYLQSSSEPQHAELIRLQQNVKRSSQLERQKLRTMLIELSPSPCPICSLPIHQAAAAASARLLDIERNEGPTAYRCACCGVELQTIVPLFGPPSYLWKANLTPAQVDLIRGE